MWLSEGPPSGDESPPGGCGVLCAGPLSRAVAEGGRERAALTVVAGRCGLRVVVGSRVAVSALAGQGSRKLPPPWHFRILMTRITTEQLHEVDFCGCC